MQTTHEIAIAGGGMIGAALACALRGEKLALVSQGPVVAVAENGFDARVYALSPANAAFLAGMGAWDAIPRERKTPVHAMRVYGDDGASRIEFDAYRSGVAQLAWIIEDRAVQASLWRALAGQDGLTRYDSCAVDALEFGEQGAELRLTDGRHVAAHLVIGADGARSTVREQAGIAIGAQDYGQTAVVANFASERPHRNVALQWFMGAEHAGSVLALLPLPGNHVSMVWSTGSTVAARLLALEPQALAREVAGASHRTLGDLSLVTPARGLPLQRLAARRLVAPRVVLAGDAAHVIHPLAGQGANLGLQDAGALAEVLRGREPGRDPGDQSLLRRYERTRAEAILAMQVTVHGLFRLFDAPGPGFGRLRNAGLNLADRMPVLKNMLMRHAMGG
ncbi:MAG: UbiH/UbiF family hydroxylase [Burkholderiales bacterium]